VFSCAYELGVKISAPIGESISGGIINLTANVIGFVVIEILTPILNGK
jgi:hypothetical protein